MTIRYSRASFWSGKNLLRIFMIILVLCALIGAGWAIQWTFQDHTPSTDSLSITEGSIVPPFSVMHQNGTLQKFFELPELQGKRLFFINFWASWCESCVEEMPSMNALRESFKNSAFEIVGINLDDQPLELVPLLVQKLNLQFPVYLDPNWKLAELFDVHAVPRTVILNADRKILLVQDGPEDWNSKRVHTQIQHWLGG